MSGEAERFFPGSDVPVLFELMYEALHFLAFPGQRFPGAERLRQPVGRAGVAERHHRYRFDLFRVEAQQPGAGFHVEAGHLMQLHSHRGGLQGDRDVRGAHIVHPVPVIDIRPREILVSAGNQQHRSVGGPGSIASGEALREPGMSFRIFASRIVICPLLGIVAGRSPACRFEQQCQLFFIDGTGVV